MLFNVQSPLVGFSCVFKAVPKPVFVVVLVHDVAELACLGVAASRRVGGWICRL
jgi:hypothetical protein